MAEIPIAVMKAVAERHRTPDLIDVTACSTRRTCVEKNHLAWPHIGIL